jgi:O-antigen/teichoic acid export membrane protein
LPVQKTKSLLQNEFVKNVLTLMTGTAVGQGIALLLSPIITRLFSLEDFTAFEQYAFLLTLLSAVICGKYEFSIMQAKDYEDARHLLALSIRIAFISSIALLVVLLFTSGWIAQVYHSAALKYLLWTLPFAVFLAGVFNALNYWFSRKKNYKVAATSKLLYSAVGEPFKIIAGIVQANPAGLVLSSVADHATAAWQSWFQFKKDEPKGLGQIDQKRRLTLAKSFNHYPRFALWGGLLNNLAQWAHVAVFAFFYQEAAIIPIAYIGLSRRLFFNPLGILSSSYGQVFYQRIEQISDGTQLKKFFLQNLYRFLAFGALMVACVYILPTKTFGFIFGDEWNEALSYLRILSFWYALNFAVSSLSFIFNRLKLQAYTLVSDIVHFVAILGAFAYAKNAGYDAMGAVQCMVVVKVIYLILNLTAILYYVDRNARHSANNSSI